MHIYVSKSQRMALKMWTIIKLYPLYLSIEIEFASEEFVVCSHQFTLLLESSTGVLSIMVMKM